MNTDRPTESDVSPAGVLSLPVVDGCCEGESCDDTGLAGLSRRGFLALGATTAAAAASGGLWPSGATAVPASRHLSRERLAGLAERGQPTEYTGAALNLIGMPVGGACTGQVYLSGDGRLWLWDVFNADSFRYGGADWLGVHYAEPLTVDSPFTTGFALRCRRSDTTDTRRIDADGFADVRFRGRYPIGHVDFADEACPVQISLDAYSPFVPTQVADSSLPVTVLEYTLTNTSDQVVDGELLGLAENPVCLDSRRTQPIVLASATGGPAGAPAVLHTARAAERSQQGRPDILFEDWENGYDGWTVEGTAFGSGPVTEGECPDYFRREGELNVSGQWFVTSHNWRDGTLPADDHTGRMTSAPFTVDRRYFIADVGGGNHPGSGVHLVVDGEVVARLSGRNSEIMETESVDVSAYAGRTATVEIVDDGTGGWAHVNCDQIRFSDIPVDERPMEDLPDGGTFGLAAFDPSARVRPSISAWSTPEDWFDAPDGPAEVDAGLDRLAGTVTVPWQLEPGESRTIRFALSWHFTKISSGPFSHIDDADTLRRHYGEVYPDAEAVLADVANRGDELAEATKLFVRTWYDDSTLPYWFLERTLIPASTVATGTCYRFQDGRFYAWEGIYCCAGTCTHVWNYAQSIGRLFPELERDARERVDFGLAFHDDTGAIDYRAEEARHVAHDGQCGNVLRAYREHQMSSDAAFLRRIWPRVKKATQYLIDHDGEPDGLLEAEQYNTLDATWYGKIPWISGLYVAALRAAAEMADDMGDDEFAATCRELADRGSAQLDETLWNPEYGYYEHHVDPDHPEATNANRGCHIDQMFGQTYAHQLGLPRVFGEQKSRTALESLYRNNFLSDAQAYKKESGIDGGRVYSTEGEAGTVMCTWPFGGAEQAPGAGDPGFVAYFNEVWTGQEYQFAAHLMAEDMVDEALAVTRAIHDRHSADKRNPFNEVECSDHYTRAMMSHAVQLAAAGYEYHGPRGHLGFAPKLTPENFAAAFTVAEGWGLYRQERTGGRQVSEVQLRHGRLSVRSFATQVVEPTGTRPVIVEKVAERRRTRIHPDDVLVDGARVVISMTDPVELAAGESLVVTVL